VGAYPRGVVGAHSHGDDTRREDYSSIGVHSRSAIPLTIHTPPRAFTAPNPIHTYAQPGTSDAIHTLAFAETRPGTSDAMHTLYGIGTSDAVHTHSFTEARPGTSDAIHTLYNLGTSDGVHTHSFTGARPGTSDAMHTVDGLGTSNGVHTHSFTEEARVGSGVIVSSTSTKSLASAPTRVRRHSATARTAFARDDTGGEAYTSTANSVPQRSGHFTAASLLPSRDDTGGEAYTFTATSVPQRSGHFTAASLLPSRGLITAGVAFPRSDTGGGRRDAHIGGEDCNAKPRVRHSASASRLLSQGSVTPGVAFPPDGTAMLGRWVNLHREQQTIPQGQSSIPPKSFSTPTANGRSAPRSGSARDVGRGAGSHTPSTASESSSKRIGALTPGGGPAVLRHPSVSRQKPATGAPTPPRWGLKPAAAKGPTIQIAESTYSNSAASSAAAVWGRNAQDSVAGASRRHNIELAAAWGCGAHENGAGGVGVNSVVVNTAQSVSWSKAAEEKEVMARLVAEWALARR